MSKENTRLVHTVCPRNCFGGCSLQVYVENEKITKVRGNNNNPATKGIVCAKGIKYPERLYHEDRLLYPLKRVGQRGEKKFEKITWDEAIEIIYQQLSTIQKTYGPESLLYYAGSGNFGVMNNYPLGFWYQYGGYTGTCGHLCDPAAGVAIRYTYGTQKNNGIWDIENAKLIILWGKNPAYTDIHAMNYINKALKKGAKLVTIDPRSNESSKQSVLHLFPRCGTDGLLAIGIQKILVERGIMDEDFIEAFTFGFDAYRDFINDYDIDEILKKAEVNREAFYALIDMIEENPNFVLMTGMGLQRYTNGGQTMRAICLLPAITGSIGKAGCGYFHTDNQGLQLNWPYFPSKPEQIRLSIPMGSIASGIPETKGPPIKALWVEKANPLTSNPNIKKLKKVLEDLDFIVVLEQFMTDTAAMADLILPVAMFLEQNDLVFSYGHPYEQLKQKIVDAPEECKSDNEIYRLLGERFGYDLQYLPEDEEAILTSVLANSGLTVSLEAMKREPYLFQGYHEIAFHDRIFPTPSGKIEFYSVSLHEDWGCEPLPVYHEPEESKYSSSKTYKKYPLQFLSVHARERINSQFGQVKSLRKAGEPIIQMNEKDALQRHINQGDRVRVFNDRGQIFLKAEVGNKIKEGVINVFEGWAHHTEASPNYLTEDRITDIGNGTAFHTCLVDVEKANMP